jgi:protein TonB
MKLNERNNYIIALMLSLGFHALLLLLFISGYLASKPAHLETFPVGMVEIAKGSPDGEVGMTGPLPEKPGSVQANIPAVPNPPAPKNQEKEKNAVKPQVSPKTPPEPAIMIPKKDKNEPAAVPSKNSNPTGPVGTGNPDTGGNGKAGTGKPLGFGSGEGMVTVLGPSPSYPKSAMNEGVEGNVTLRILVKADGSLEDVHVDSSLTDSRLVNAAVSSIKRNWKFKTVTQNYFIDLVFSFHDSEVSMKFINAESRP